jgi:hypothetical protein
VTGTLPVSAGDVFQVNAGQAGAYDGDKGTSVGFGGGGEGGSDGGGGGGASDVRDGAYGLADRLLVAGGGGGGSENGTSEGFSARDRARARPGPGPGSRLDSGPGCWSGSIPCRAISLQRRARGRCSRATGKRRS